MKEDERKIVFAGSPDVDITIVMDRSGSMQTIAADAIGGFNAFVEEQKLVPGNARLTLWLFSETVHVVHEALPIAEVPELTRKAYSPGGSTALLDAWGEALDEAEKRFNGQKMIFVVLTDGQENASRKHTREAIFKRTADLKDAGWQILYLGANQDAIEEGKHLGVAQAQAMTFWADAGSVQAAYASVSRGVSSYRDGTSSTMSWSEADRTSAKGGEGK